MSFEQKFHQRLSVLSERPAFEFPPEALPEKHSKAAVLLPFWPGEDGGVEVVFTKRPETMSSHPGQVSFPGGRVDPEDESIVAAALREAEEELAIDPALVKIMGRLDDAWSIAGHHVIPYVGWLDKRPAMVANEKEVEQILIADVEMLMQPEVECEHETVTRGVPRRTLAFKWPDGYVWGLTADMFYEFLLWIKDEPSSRGHLRLDYLEIMQQAMDSN